MWFLNWGRNVIFATESTYHVLAACCWLFALRGRYWLSFGFAGLLAATHPWSGLEILATVLAFHGLRFLLGERRETAPYLAATVAALATFLAYSLAYLDTHDAHRALHETWEINWNVPTATIVLAWAPVALAAFARVVWDWRREGAPRAVPHRGLWGLVLAVGSRPVHALDAAAALHARVCLDVADVAGAALAAAGAG